MAREIFVHVDLQGETHFVGRLWVHVGQAGESASFEYSLRWRKSPLSFSLEPALALDEGVFHPSEGKSFLGAIGDSAPDRWGRVLMKRLEARTAKAEKRTSRLLCDSDYLLMANDLARQGALRFAEQDGGPYLATDSGVMIPPMMSLERLLAASERILQGKEAAQDVRELTASGAALGGARPKASVIGADGKLLIAKFPSPKDAWDVVLWEYLALQMAKKAGIKTPGAELAKIGGKNVLLLQRFDRDGAWRVPFLSAMSMLGYSDGDQGSYLEIAEILSEHGVSTSRDLKELWRRIVFNIMVSNVDDHLRNHGFLYTGTDGWSLSPLYDLEPTPAHEKNRVLHTFIDLNDGSASLDLAYSVAEEFGIGGKAAKAIAKEVANATKGWAKGAARLGAVKGEIEMMSSAFDHEELKQALKN